MNIFLSDKKLEWQNLHKLQKKMKEGYESILILPGHSSNLSLSFQVPSIEKNIP